jgi:hypothetical protein
MLEEKQRLGDLISCLLPKSYAVGKECGGKDGLRPPPHDRSDVGEKLDAAALEPDSRRRHVVIPRSSKRPAPSVSQQYGLWPGSLGSYSI